MAAKKNVSEENSLIIQTLLQLGDIVMCISDDLTVSGVWLPNSTDFEYFTKYSGQNINDHSGDQVLGHLKLVSEAAFKKQPSMKAAFPVQLKGAEYFFNARAVSNGTDEHSIFIIIENTSIHKPEIAGDKWKLALDASGDGVWDMRIDTNQMFFSSKWYEIFGYNPEDIKTVEDWTSKVHPDDLAIAAKNFNLHNTGVRPIYSCEIRYLCKDGATKWILSRGVIVSKTPDGIPVRFIGTHQDINERKLMEEEHQANISLLLQLMDSLPSGILVTDENNKLIFTNKAFCKMYGIEIGPRELTGLNAEESLQNDKSHYKEPEQLVERIARILEARDPVFGEELTMLDGRIISRDYIPLSFKENCKGEIWKFTDVTQQKNAEKRFEEQRFFYETILNGITADIVVHDADLKILFVNPKAIKDKTLREWLIGKTVEDYCNYRNLPLSLAESRTKYLAYVQTEKKSIEFEEKMEMPDGRVTYCLRCLFPVLKPSGDIDIVIVYGVDITDRKLAEEALKTNMNAFANSFNFSGIGKALISTTGMWLEVNSVLCKMLGYTREEFLAMHTKEVVYPEDATSDLQKIMQLLNKEIDTYSVEKRYVSKERHIIVASVTVSLLWNADNTPKYFICDIIDVTAQKMLSDELYRQNVELEATKTTLVNKINQLEDLSYMIAHNLRGPANNIKMLSERLIIDDNDPRAEEEVFTKDEAGTIIYESSISLSNSLNALMELTQIKLNKNIAFNDCELTTFIGEITNQLQGIIYEKHAEIKLNLEVASVNYPKVYLESILYNLISNALKYSRKDVVPEIIIRSAMQEDKVVLTVKDNGLGIDLEKYGDKVFVLNKVFHQGYDSKGVGLFLTKSQIESLGGTIEVRSKVNEGCEFIVTL